MFSPAILFFFAAQPLHGQTNGPFTLLPPHGELPPTFFEQHAASVSAGGIGLMALVAIAAWFFLRAKPEIIIPPGAQARQALQTLRGQPEDGHALSRVSQIVRHYFIAAFQLPPGEFTTSEFSRLIADHESIGAELAAATTGFLRDCDARKFSAGGTNETFNATDQALNLIGRAETRRAQLTPTQSPRA